MLLMGCHTRRCVRYVVGDREVHLHLCGFPYCCSPPIKCQASNLGAFYDDMMHLGLGRAGHTVVALSRALQQRRNATAKRDSLYCHTLASPWHGYFLTLACDMAEHCRLTIPAIQLITPAPGASTVCIIEPLTLAAMVEACQKCAAPVQAAGGT
jgi:hypothetical protein